MLPGSIPTRSARARSRPWRLRRTCRRARPQAFTMALQTLEIGGDTSCSHAAHVERLEVGNELVVRKRLGRRDRRDAPPSALVFAGSEEIGDGTAQRGGIVGRQESGVVADDLARYRAI